MITLSWVLLILYFSFSSLYPDGFWMHFLQKHLQWHDIKRTPEDLYIRRFFLIHPEFGLFRNPKWRTVFIHYIARSDDDDHLHDHPWGFISVLLSWSYVEEDKTGFHRIWPFMPRYREATYQHRLHLSRPVWTLFIHYDRIRDWGFQTKERWVPHTEYLGSVTKMEQPS